MPAATSTISSPTPSREQGRPRSADRAQSFPRRDCEGVARSYAGGVSGGGDGGALAQVTLTFLGAEAGGGGARQVAVEDVPLETPDADALVGRGGDARAV